MVISLPFDLAFRRHADDSGSHGCFARNSHQESLHMGATSSGNSLRFTPCLSSVRFHSLSPRCTWILVGSCPSLIILTDKSWETPAHFVVLRRDAWRDNAGAGEPKTHSILARLVLQVFPRFLHPLDLLAKFHIRPVTLDPHRFPTAGFYLGRRYSIVRYLLPDDRDDDLLAVRRVHRFDQSAGALPVRRPP